MCLEEWATAEMPTTSWTCIGSRLAQRLFLLAKRKLYHVARLDGISEMVVPFIGAGYCIAGNFCRYKIS